MRALLLLVYFLMTARQTRQKDIETECPEQCSCLHTSRTIQCDGRKLSEVPEMKNNTASNAESLHLENNAISQLDLSFLNAYPDLNRLNLNSNNLRSLLKGPESTESPNFSGGSNILVQLDLSSNHLHVLHSFVFSGFPHLKTLNLSGNDIHTISANAFNLPSLETLDLSDNKLEVIGVHMFDTSPKLSDVLLGRNRLSRINDRTFGLLSHLQVLDLSRNQLMWVEEDVFVGMNITHLDLGYNDFKRIPSRALSRMTKAQTLVLDGNLFQTLEKNSLIKINVEFLSLSNNPSLTRIDKDAIHSLPNLRTFTLNHNPKLTYIFPGAMAALPQLVALDLSNNGLYALESEVVSQLSHLKALYLSGNNFKCHCSLGWINLHHKQLQIKDLDSVQCHPDINDQDNSVSVRQLDRFTSQCEPYILPLFPKEQVQVMGKNVTWLCKALGSGDLALMWRLPKKSAIVGNGECLDRACVDANALTVRYLHPEDVGRYGCVAKNNYGQDQRQIHLDVKSEHIQIFPITVSSTFVTLSWNTSSILTTGRGYILRVKEEVEEGEEVLPTSVDLEASFWTESQRGRPVFPREKLVKQYEDIDVGLKMNSYTVNGLVPGHRYTFELCLRKAEYVIPISSTVMITKDSQFEMDLGIKTDYVSLFAVAIVLTGLITTCVVTSIMRAIRFHNVFYKKNRNCDSSSQREMIVSPSDHSSVTNAYNNTVVSSGGHVVGVSHVVTTNHGAGTKDVSGSFCNRSILSGDQSRLVDNEVVSPVDETIT